ISSVASVRAYCAHCDLAALLALFLRFFSLLVIPPPLRSTLFPYTTLFRSLIIANTFLRCLSVTLYGSLTITSHSTSSPLSNSKRSEEHTSELQSRFDLVCRLLLEKKKQADQSPRHKPKQ